MKAESELIDQENRRHDKTKRMYELWEVGQYPFDSWIAKKLPSLQEIGSGKILLSIFRAEFPDVKAGAKTIRLPLQYKAARLLAEYLQMELDVPMKIFCSVFRQRNGKPFKENVLSQQPKGSKLRSKPKRP